MLMDVFASIVGLAVIFAAVSADAAPPSGGTDDLIFLQNSEFKIGIKPSSGAAIAWVSSANAAENLVDHWDRGRLIQQSYYGRDDGSDWNGKPWRWNPVQGGGWRDEPARVLKLFTTPTTCYARTLPKHWATGADVNDAVMEQWITLHRSYVHVHYRFQYHGSEAHPARHQELPAVFVHQDLKHLIVYDGDQPWKSKPLSKSVPGWPNEHRKTTENWAAYVNDQDQGIGIYNPTAEELTCYRFGVESNLPSACSYFAPLKTIAITPGLTWDHDVYIALGAPDQIRGTFERLHQHPEPFSEEDWWLNHYLERRTGNEVSQVAVQQSEVVVTGKTATGDEALHLIEVPLYQSIQAKELLLPGTLPGHELPVGPFELRFPRIVKDATRSHDRLLSRWAVARKVDDAWQLVSPAVYATDVFRDRDPATINPRNRKGLGAFGFERPLEDIEALDISAVTVNIPINPFLHTRAGDQTYPYEYQGKTWYVHRPALERLDRVLQAAAQKNLLVSAIILVPQAKGFADATMGQLVAHPDATAKGIFVMPNCTTADGMDAYAAIMNLLAERYSQADGRYGRIHHWIMHNEVNSGWVWTNAGRKSCIAYTDLLHRSLRLTHLIVRQYDPHGKVFVSLDHHWTSRHLPECHPARDLLEHFTALSRTEGDFDWAIAHHPYPENLFEPRVWLDKTVTDDLETPKISFKNLAVLEQWLQLPSSKIRGEQVRECHLTEQGLNSRDYAEKSLQDQAEGLKYAWQKLDEAPSIHMFHYHNWVDNRHEGGLRIGLRRFPDDDQEPLGKKPVWHVYRELK